MRPRPQREPPDQTRAGPRKIPCPRTLEFQSCQPGGTCNQLSSHASPGRQADTPCCCPSFPRRGSLGTVRKTRGRVQDGRRRRDSRRQRRRGRQNRQRGRWECAKKRCRCLSRLRAGRLRRGLFCCGRGWWADHGCRGSRRQRRGHGQRARWFCRLVAVLSIFLNWSRVGRRPWGWLCCPSFNISRRGSGRGRGHHGCARGAVAGGAGGASSGWQAAGGGARGGTATAGEAGRSQLQDGPKRRVLRILQGVRKKPLRRHLGRSLLYPLCAGRQASGGDCP